jgi:hypothetical protein
VNDGRTPGDASAAHASDDLLVDLAFGLADATAANAAMEHLRTCGECEARLREVVADRERGRSALAEGAAAPPARPAPRSGARVPAFARRRDVLVATAALAAGLAVVFSLARPPRLRVEPVWIAAPGDPTESRSPAPGPAGDEFRRGLAAYRAHRADSAIVLLAAARPADEGLDRLRRIHLASACVFERRPADALDALAGLDLEALPHPWRGEAMWVRACALEQAGRAGDGRAQLERLARENGEAGTRARQALAGGRR